ncbi:MAG: NAD-dependent succinate-semialdehyde dehydrogenase [Acidobacteriaceae bacterium]
MDYPELQLLIAGEWRGRAGHDTLPVVDPATEQVLAELPIANDADLDAALDAASATFAEWRDTPAADRAAILQRAAGLLRERADEIGRIQTLEEGKGLTESISEVVGAADLLQWSAEEGRRAYGRIVPSRVHGGRSIVLREPLGPVAAFTPWNFPILIPARKLGAALAAGCPAVFKPAEETPATGFALAAALVDAGLPPGVLSVVCGNPQQISEHLITSPAIRKVTFTGSTPIGIQIAGLAAQRVIPATLELGGHAPVVVFADADIPRAVKMLVASKFRNAGQICIAPSRFIVQENVVTEFTEQFVTATRELRVGNGLDPEVNMGPLANERRGPAIEALVQDAVASGATVLAGGHPIDGSGYFWEPTVLSGLDPEKSRVMNEEPFGPIAPIVPFASLDDGIALANRVPFGLASYAFTTSLSTARYAAASIQAGMVGVNDIMIMGPETPFGGVKASGYGSESGTEGLESFMHAKYVRES